MTADAQGYGHRVLKLLALHTFSHLAIGVSGMQPPEQARQPAPRLSLDTRSQTAPEIQHRQGATTLLQEPNVRSTTNLLHPPPVAGTRQARNIKPTTCLSVDYHDKDDIGSNLSHYLGCVRFSDRKEFYESLPKEEQEPIRSELKRIIFIRDVLKNSREREDRLALGNLENSLKAWRTAHKTDIEDTARRRQEQGWKRAGEPHEPVGTALGRGNVAYSSVKDLKAYVIEFDEKGGIENSAKVLRGKFPNQKTSVHELLYGDQSPLKKATYQKPDGATGDQEGPASPDGKRHIRYFHFPANNMKWVEDAMSMYYGEIGTQFDNKYRIVKKENRTRANTLLRRDFWYGQEQGHGARATHARHLRPLCAQVSSDPRNTEAEGHNLVLFMPFLHWEKDRQRHNFTDMIDKSCNREANRLLQEQLRERTERRKERYELHKGRGNRAQEHANTCEAWKTANGPEAQKKPLDRTATGSGHKPLSEMMHSAFSRQPSGLWKHMTPAWPYHDKDGRIRTGNTVGQVLYDAFKLYETLNNYRDRRMIDEYLHHEPRMHTRRTLDQAYYWTLPNTRVRDRDQVVYRQTSADPRTLHHYEPEPKVKGVEKWECRREEAKAEKFESERSKSEHVGDWIRSAKTKVFGGTGPSDDPEANRELKCTHKAPELHRECLSCKEAIQKVPRVVMVDQLWMWILDDTTVITFFPKRYGVNRQDPSGVHKAIRQKLSNMSTEKIRSAYDLGRIIIKECTSLFFDRIKTDARQPQVVDIFSEAIGEMAQKSTLSFDHLWHWADELAKAPGNKSSWVELSQIHLALLNITPEGKLQRETKDIIEELGIMLYIWRKQKEVLKGFKKNGANLLDRDGHFKEKQRGVTPSSSTFQTGPSRGGRTGSSSSAWYEDCWNYFHASVDEVMQDHDDQMEELDGLQKSAEQVSKNLEHLLALKQQQAGVLQAWQAIRHGEEAVKQGRAIMIFTVITIVFLPLAFMAAIFGMNNRAFKDDAMALATQLKLMFTISIGVIVFVILAAFSNTVRTIIWTIMHISLNWLLISSGLYSLWLEFPESLKPENMAHWAQKKMQDKKDEARKRVRRKKRRKEARRRDYQAQQRDKAWPTIEAAPLLHRSHASVASAPPNVTIHRPTTPIDDSVTQSSKVAVHEMTLFRAKEPESASSQTADPSNSGGSGSEGPSPASSTGRR